MDGAIIIGMKAKKISVKSGKLLPGLGSSLPYIFLE